MKIKEKIKIREIVPFLSLIAVILFFEIVTNGTLQRCTKGT